MAKIIDYPRASFKYSLEVASAVDSLGGKCSLETCAKKLGKKVSGAFYAVVAAAAKFGFISNTKGILAVSPLYKRIKLAYNETERLDAYREAFLSPAVFKALAERFNGNVLPIEMLPNLFAREYGVEENFTTTLANYFVDGARAAGLLDGTQRIQLSQEQHSPAPPSNEVQAVEVVSEEPQSLETRQRVTNSGKIQDTPYELVSPEVRKIQIPLTGRKLAELIVPVDLVEKDLDIIALQLQVLKLYVESS